MITYIFKKTELQELLLEVVSYMEQKDYSEKIIDLKIHGHSEKVELIIADKEAADEREKGK